MLSELASAFIVNVDPADGVAVEVGSSVVGWLELAFVFGCGLLV